MKRIVLQQYCNDPIFNSDLYDEKKIEIPSDKTKINKKICGS
jgi:hypothetical protein